MTSRTKTLTAALAVLAALAGGYYALNMTPAAPADAATDATAQAQEAETAAPVKQAPPAITVTTVDNAVLRDRIRASGLVAALERVNVQPKIEGQPVEDVLAEVGDHVAKGAVLARLSDTALKLEKSQLAASRASAVASIAQAEAQLVEAQASAEEAWRTMDRAEQLHKQGNTAKAAADQAATAYTSANARVMVARQGAEAAKAQLELVEAQMANLELQLERTLIIAPVAGEVVQKNALAGSIASASNDPMFVIVRDGILELNADIAEQDLPRMAAGQRAVLRAAGVRQELTGTVRLIEPAIDEVTRLGRARISIDQADRVRSGMFLEAEIEVSEREVLAVPITAIGTDDEGAFVMTVDDGGRVHRNTVTTGIRDGGLVEIEDGVAKGDRVVAKAASFVRDGDLVNPVAAATAEAIN
jgi:HlyD family secretion protein